MSGRRERQRALEHERQHEVIEERRRAAANRRWAEQAEQFEIEMAASYAFVPPPPPVIPEPPLLLSRRLDETATSLRDDPEGTAEIPLLAPPDHRRAWPDLVDGGELVPTPAGRMPRHHAPGAWAGEVPARTDRTLTALLAGFLIVVLGSTVAATWYLLDRRQDRAGTVVAPPQPTLLVLVTGERQAVLGGAVIGAGPTRADAVLLPGGLRLDVPGRGATTLTAELRGSTGSPAEALSNALGVRIDGTWVLSQAGVGSLVDSLGGVRTEPDAQLLDGRQAAVSVADPSRIGPVLTGLLAGLDDDREVLAAQVAVLGRQTSTTLPAQQLTTVLLALHQAARGGLVAEPVPLDGAATTARIDQAGAQDVVRARLPRAAVAVNAVGAVQVLVRNAVGVPGLNAVARTRLLQAGLRYTSGGNAPTFARAPSQVLVPSGSATDMLRGRAVARALGIPQEAVRADSQAVAAGAVVALLGSDFADSTDQVPPSTVTASRP